MALELLLSALSSLGFLGGNLLYFKSKIEVDSFFNKFNFKIKGRYFLPISFVLGFAFMYFLLENMFVLALIIFAKVLITGSLGHSYKKNSFMSLLFFIGALIKYLF
jgi:hypothetical protein